MYTYAISVYDGLMSQPEYIEALGNAKLNRIELSCNAAATAYRIGSKVSSLAAAQDAGKLTVSSIHIPFGGGWEFSSPYETLRQTAVGLVRDFIEACAPLHCRNFTMHGCLEPVPTEPAERQKHLVAFRQTVTDLLPTLRKYGVSLNIEDLPRTCLGNTIEELSAMLDGFPLENVGVTFDVNHFCNSSERLVEGIRTFADRIRAFHISDYDGIDECHWYPGLGIIDWAAIMDAVRQLPNDVVLIFEAFQFLAAPRRDFSPALHYKSFERCVFELENAAEIQRRIASQIIP